MDFLHETCKISLFYFVFAKENHLMKKTLTRLSALILALFVLPLSILTGCKQSSDVTTGGTTEEISLQKMVKEIYKGCGDTKFPSLATVKVNTSDKDRFSFYFGTEDTSGVVEAVVSEPKMSSIAYSLALVRLDDKTDPAAFADKIEKSVNPGRWVCVVADYIETAVNGRVVLLLLDTDEARVNAVIDSFKKL